MSSVADGPRLSDAGFVSLAASHTANDLKQHSVILLGSSFQNVAVAQLPTMGDFLYLASDSLHDLWGGRIVNIHPLANERTDYYRTERDPTTGTLKADYAHFPILPRFHCPNPRGVWCLAAGAGP